MSDLISRQAAIDVTNGLTSETAEFIRAYLKALPSAQPEQRWIPVSERLPEERHYDDSDYVEPSDSVLVFTSYKTYYISRYWGHRTSKGESSYVIPDWMDLDEYISDAVVAWIPLPKPWEGET